jgi:hypothetical protein
MTTRDDCQEEYYLDCAAFAGCVCSAYVRARSITIVKKFPKAVRHGTRYDEPYLLYTFSPFTKQLYNTMLSNLPRNEDYRPWEHPDAIRSDGTSARLLFPLKPDRIRRCFSGESREFWLDLAHILRDVELADLFKQVLEPDLKKRFGTRLSEIKAFPALLLSRDYPSFHLRIHKDHPTKLITTQYYLPADSSQKHLGTNIYRRRRDDGFEMVRKINFVPRKSYCFAVSSNSWHSVDPMNPGEPPRNSMMLIYYRMPGIDDV